MSTYYEGLLANSSTILEFIRTSWTITACTKDLVFDMLSFFLGEGGEGEMKHK